MRVAIGMLSKPQRGVGGGADGQGGGMHVARPMCMRMSGRIRGYVSTSSHPALMHEHVGAAAAGEAGLYLIGSRARLSAMPTCMCISNVGMVGLRPVQSICSVRACGRGRWPGGHARARTRERWSDR
jgi:hypothetical protein